MTFHRWGDNWPYWDKLSEAQDFLRYQLKDIHHLPLTDLKEKWGCLRIWLSPSFTLHNLIWPGHMFGRWPKYLKFMWTLDIYFWPKFGKYTGLSYLYNCYVNRAIQMSFERTVKAFPEVKDEILHDAPSRLLSYISDWNDYWIKTNDGRYPDPNPAWVAYWKQHESKTYLPKYINICNKILVNYEEETEF